MERTSRHRLSPLRSYESEHLFQSWKWLAKQNSLWSIVFLHNKEMRCTCSSEDRRYGNHLFQVRDEEEPHTPLKWTSFQESSAGLTSSWLTYCTSRCVCFYTRRLWVVAPSGAPHSLLTQASGSQDIPNPLFHRPCLNTRETELTTPPSFPTAHEFKNIKI